MSNGLNPLLAYAAGALTILSPCVLPLVPIVIGSAAQRHKWGPAVLAAGLLVSFTLVGFTVAALGASSGLDPDLVREIGAVVLLLVGLLLIVPKAQHLAEQAAAPLAEWASRKQQGLERFGLIGQAGIGVLLGLVWSPCVGPTLGAATVLAAEGKDLGQVALVMAAFGAGIATMLLLVALATRGFLARWRGRLMGAGAGGKRVLGGLVMAVAVLILTGGDHLFEAAVLGVSPDWLTNLTTMI
ncbi:MAG: cytochrome c biogenesis CcdA family protein [Sphingomicrobium sp.]|nr:cytochrome c biogenesis CcdA family protein [Sphingomonadales bacterium]